METMTKEMVVESELPKGWRVLPIEDCLAPINGKKKVGQGWSPQCEKEASPSATQWGVLKTTAIQAGEFLEGENKLLPENLEPRPQIEVKAGDLLTTCAGPRSRCGVTCLVRETRPRLMISGKMYRYRADKAVIDAEYLEAYLQTQQAWDAIDKMKTGGSDSGLNLTHDRFLALPIPVAPLPQQRRIVSAIETQLGRLDAAVANLDAAKAKLKRYKQAVLKAAVEGALTEEWRAKQKRMSGAQQLLEEILAERKHTAIKSKDKQAIAPGDDLPKLTDGWVWASLEQIGQPNRPIIYGIIKPGPHVEDGVPYVRVTEMKDGTIDVDSLRKASKERAAKFARATLAAGDVLISKDGTIGRVAVVPPELEGGNITQHVMRAPVSRLVDRDYIVWAIRSDQCQNWLTGETRGVALRGVNVEDFRRLPIPLPPRNEQTAIVAQVEDRMARTAQLEATLDAQLLQSTRLRQAVLKRAFEGRLV
jgi:type I restriction enzyme S subunit